MLSVWHVIYVCVCVLTVQLQFFYITNALVCFLSLEYAFEKNCNRCFKQLLDEVPEAPGGALLSVSFDIWILGGGQST